MPVFDVEEHLALNRLIEVAKRDTGQARRVANLLLAWFNAETYGGFDLTDLWSIDEEVVADIVLVLQLISKNPMRYPDVFDRSEDIQQIIALHR
jgi:hypothetical protein